MNLNELSQKAIGLSIEVHRNLGPGLLESAYESALCIELEEAGLRFERQLLIPALYKGRTIGEYRLDLLIEDALIIEIQSVERHDPVFAAQVLTSLRITGKKLGLLINFNSHLLASGIRRLIL